MFTLIGVMSASIVTSQAEAERSRYENAHLAMGHVRSFRLGPGSMGGRWAAANSAGTLNLPATESGGAGRVPEGSVAGPREGGLWCRSAPLRMPTRRSSTAQIEPQVKVGELLVVDRRGSAQHQVAPRLGLGKGRHLA